MESKNATTIVDVDVLKNDTTVVDVDVLKNETNVAYVELHPPSDDEDDAVIVISSDGEYDDIIVISSDDEDDNFIVISSNDKYDVASTLVQPQVPVVGRKRVYSLIDEDDINEEYWSNINSEIVSTFGPMDVDVVVNPTVASVDEELYVALSRGISRTTTKVLVKPEKEFGQEGVYTSNVVYQEVLRDE
ncbi:hypothetical protein Tco_0025563 [Tanacetum coccineum]